MYFKADETGRVYMAAEQQWGGMTFVEPPADFNEHRLNDYMLVNGELVYDPLPEPTPEPSQDEQIDMLNEAVADMSEVVSNNAIDSADMADAIAELSEMVSQLMEGA